jgi:DNA-binding phage protein
MVNTETPHWNIQDSLKTPEDIILYLESAMETEDKEFIFEALRDIYCSKGLEIIITGE